MGGIGDKLNSAAGGGRESEKNEDYLDKGMFSSINVPPFRFFIVSKASVLPEHG